VDVKLKIVELASIVLVAGALVLLGLKTISFEQALTLITIAVSLLTGKYLSWYEDRIMEKFKKLFGRV